MRVDGRDTGSRRPTSGRGRARGGYRMFGLDDKICVVTGASRGIGRAIALRFADQGAHLVLAARSQRALDDVRARIEAKGRQVCALTTDVTDLSQLRALADT